MRNRKSFRERLARRALLAGSLAMGLVLGSGVAYAYWTFTPSTITDIPALTSGVFDLTVGPSGTEGLATWCGGSLCDPTTSSSYTWTAATIGNMYPGESFAFQLTIDNSSTGDAAMSVTANSLSVNTGNFGSYLTVTAYGFGSVATNSGTNLGGRTGSCSGSTLALPATTTLSSPGATTSICVLVSLSIDTPGNQNNGNNPPPSLQGAAVTAPFSLTLSAQQAPNS